ncbi:anti-sigma regulatory factor (Ser/Thr protein kinase) [Streptomyces sp. B3I7]|nr:anti-sigma regulatory factor (Ser/Thr protein kinase) [Streptomyces sp. B3I7]
MTYGAGIRGIMNGQPVSELRRARGRAGRTGRAEDARLRLGLGAADLRSVSEVRRELRELLDDRAEPDRSAVAELLTSELVANALVHTDREAVVTAVVSGGELHVEVRDFAESGPAPRPSPAQEEPDAAVQRTNGRGLVLVRALADAWGVRAHGVGKTVWFELTDLTTGAASGLTTDRAAVDTAAVDAAAEPTAAGAAGRATGEAADGPAGAPDVGAARGLSLDGDAA